MIMLKQRPAIAMIELIFAIMIMGIVMMSAPQMLTTSSQSSYTAIQQEGINEVATQMNIILGYEWDENNTAVSHHTVLYVTNGHVDLNGIIDLPRRRAGTATTSHRLFISYDGDDFNASTIGGDGADEIIDDIDDFNGTTIHLTLDGATTKTDYIEKGNDINISRTVTYMNDSPTGNTYVPAGGLLNFNPTFTSTIGTTNIKRIQVTLTSNSNITELNKTIILHAFSCNIGSYKLEERQ